MTGTGGIAPAALRQQLFFAALLGLLETVLFTALSPVLPELARETPLSTSQAGILSAAYPAGIVFTALPAGYVVARIGGRVTAVAGLAVLGAGSLGFAYSSSALTLEATRFLQGCGSGAAWSGALAWLAASYPIAERGGAMGVAFRGSFVGIMLGPFLGAVASSFGRPLTFVALGVFLAAVAVWGARMRIESEIPESSETKPSFQPLVSVGFGVSIVALVSLGILVGGLGALAPLLLADRGVGAAVIAACFVIAALPQVGFTSALGRRLARGNLVGFICLVFLASAVALPLAPAAAWAPLTAAVITICLQLAFVGFNPGMMLSSAIAERVGGDQGMAMSIANGAWGLGAAVGALLLAVVAEEITIATGFAVGAGIGLVTAILLAVASTSGYLLRPSSRLQRQAD